MVAAAVMSGPGTVAPAAVDASRTMPTEAIRTMIMEMTEVRRCLRARLISPAIRIQETNGFWRNTRIKVHRPLSNLGPRQMKLAGTATHAYP